MVLATIALLKGKWRGSLTLLAGWGLILLVNLFWILPFFQFKGQLDLSLSWDYFLTQDNISFRSWFLTGDLSRLVLLGLGLLGLSAWFRRRRDLCIGFSITVFILFGLLCLFPWPTFLLLMRRRYDWMLTLYLLLPASEWVWDSIRQGQPSPKKVTACVAVFVLLVTSDPSRYATCLKRLLIPDKSFQTAWPLPTSMVPEEQDKLLNWIRTRTTPEARILIEDSLHPQHIFWRAHLPAILALLTQREYIGGPIPEAETKYAFVNFYSGILFRKKISDMDPSFLKTYLDLYNIRWIICFTPEAKSVFEQFPSRDIQKELTTGPFSCYRLNRKGDFFLKGSGKVRAGFNRFELSEVKPVGGEVILKYHWMEGLKTDPSCQIEPFFYLDDPIGLIRIVDPPEKLEIRLQP